MTLAPAHTLAPEPLKLLEDALKRFMSLSPWMSIQGVSILLYVSRMEQFQHAPTPSELGRELGFTASMASRIAYALAQGPSGEPDKGLGLVEFRISEHDRRRHTIHLTDEGRKFLEGISEIFR